MTNADFYVKQTVDLSGKNFYQERMVLMLSTAMNSTMRYFQFRCKTSFCFRYKCSAPDAVRSLYEAKIGCRYGTHTEYKLIYFPASALY